MTSFLKRFAITFTLMASATSLLQGQERDAESTQRFGGQYSGLREQERALIDDLFRRYNAVADEKITAEAGYNRTRLSLRTTFEAVTHALGESELTDENGESLGTALDLLNHLEAVHGKIKGARGDQQFRIYVRLEAGAVNALERSQQFLRGHDNTVYHKGYPINYRQGGGVPSIQFSVAADLSRADIDVDYRAAKFPGALFNGHLTAANSDVRAGDNADLHNDRWEGFADFWRGFFGVSLLGETYEGEEITEDEIPEFPRAGREDIHVAANDFLQAWLVEKDARSAAAYMSTRTVECLVQERGADPATFDYGMAPFELIRGMQAVANEVGDVTSLDGVTVGVRLSQPGLLLVRHENHAQFVLYGVTRELAAAFDCSNRTKLGELLEVRRVRRGAKLEDFTHFGTIFYLNPPHGRGATLALLWTKENGHWKIVSYEVEPSATTAEVSIPDIRAATETAEPAREAGDPTLIAANNAFLESWILEKDIDKALRFIAPTCLPCVNLELNPGESRLATREVQAARMRLGLERSADHFGSIARLEDAISSVDAWVPEVRVITHAREDTYSLYGIPDWMGEDADCQKRVEGREATPLEARKQTFGKYYVSAFHVNTIAGETVALLLGWTKTGDGWRIFSYQIEEP